MALESPTAGFKPTYCTHLNGCEIIITNALNAQTLVFHANATKIKHCRESGKLFCAINYNFIAIAFIWVEIKPANW